MVRDLESPPRTWQPPFIVVNPENVHSVPIGVGGYLRLEHAAVQHPERVRDAPQEPGTIKPGNLDNIWIILAGGYVRHRSQCIPIGRARCLELFDDERPVDPIIRRLNVEHEECPRIVGAQVTEHLYNVQAWIGGTSE